MQKEILFRSSSIKLKKGYDENAILSWDIQGASAVTLDVPLVGLLTLSPKGEYKVQPKTTTTYTLSAVFPDGSTQTKHMKIEVLPYAQGSFDVKEIHDVNGVHAELRWFIKDALEVQIDGVLAPSSGFKKYLVTKTITPTISYKDAFGTRKKTIKIEHINEMFWNEYDKATNFANEIFIDVLNSSIFFLNFCFKGIYSFLKLIVRPFTFWGRAYPNEYKIFSWILFIVLLATIGNTIYPYIHQLNIPVIYTYKSFKECYISIGIIFYLWIMLLGKRYKTSGQSPWNALWFCPLMFVYLITEIFPVPLFFTAYKAGAVIYAIYIIVFLTEVCNVNSTNSRYKRTLKKEFLPEYSINAINKKKREKNDRCYLKISGL